jgi:2-polyprenyl-3-methyl-5-hydroxy-6-metoxy-1,4-benzoquinol methylase
MMRTELAAPVRWLHECGLLQGRCLDYGCGHGFDAITLGMDAYDPNYKHRKYPTGKYDTIICQYVLNTIRSHIERNDVLHRIQKLLKRDGRAFIIVRRDIKGWRWTKNGWQGNVRVPGISLKKTRGYEIYVID